MPYAVLPWEISDGVRTLFYPERIFLTEEFETITLNYLNDTIVPDYQMQGQFVLEDNKFKYGISGKWMVDKKKRIILSGGNRRDVEQTGVSLTATNDVLGRSFASAAGARLPHRLGHVRVQRRKLLHLGNHPHDRRRHPR